MLLKMLNRFSCIALAGVVTEYLLYGYAEGGLADINKVCAVPVLGFSIKSPVTTRSCMQTKVTVLG